MLVCRVCTGLENAWKWPPGGNVYRWCKEVVPHTWEDAEESLGKHSESFTPCPLQVSFDLLLKRQGFADCFYVSWWGKSLAWKSSNASAETWPKTQGDWLSEWDLLWKQFAARYHKHCNSRSSQDLCDCAGRHHFGGASWLPRREGWCHLEVSDRLILSLKMFWRKR